MIIKKIVYNHVTQISIPAKQLVRCKIILTIYKTHQKFSHVVIKKTNNLLFNKQQIWKIEYASESAAKSNLITNNIKVCMKESDRIRKCKKNYIRKIKRAWEENINDFEWSFLNETYLLTLIVVSTRFKYAEIISFVLTVIVEQTAETIRDCVFIAIISTEDWKILEEIDVDALKHLR